MSDEQDLPHLPGIAWDERSQTFRNNPRKRVRLGNQTPLRPDIARQVSHNSSDPAFFSSDDDPALDNYIDGRRKKRYIGSWFQQHPASSDSQFNDGRFGPSAKPGTKRTLARQFDSGVFLGSDSSESGDGEIIDMPLRPKLVLEPRVAPMSKGEARARDIIQHCVDQGQETVDLYGLDINHLSSDTIERLSYIAAFPSVSKDVAFANREPELKLNLSVNSLRRLSSSFFDLTNLTFLSLRGNNLSELPSALRHLRNLKELNISQNRLHFLPAELLELMQSAKLESLILHPNPFALAQGQLDECSLEIPAAPVAGDTSSPRSDVWESRLVSQRLGRSPLQISDPFGRALTDFTLPPANGARVAPRIQALKDNGPGSDDSVSSQRRAGQRAVSSRPTAVPSLLESALRTCYTSGHLPTLHRWVPEGFAHLWRLLDKAKEVREAGGLSCSHCRRFMVTPVAQWVEWRALATVKSNGSMLPTGTVLQPMSKTKEEIAVPFLHKTCSQLCGPRPVVKRTWRVPDGFVSLLPVE